MFDLVIRGGTVVDGSGAPGRRADVGVGGETIAAIGDLGRAEAGRVVDADGLVVAPGFIDTHTHAEGALLVDPQCPMGVRQGITTLFLGIDGMSYAPLSPENYRTYRRWLGGLLGDPPIDLDMRSVAAFRGHYHRKVAVNTAYLVPQGTVRLEVAGFRDVPLRGDDLAMACRLVREGLEQGAVGLSTGSKYYPGPWADTAELIALGRVVREAGAVYMCEPRSANLERAHGGHGVTEAVEVARRSGARLHLAHYRTAAATAGRIDRIMEHLEPARATGLDVTFDIYPYPAGSSIPVSFLPSDAQEGGPDAILARLRDPGERRRIAASLDAQESLPMAEVILSYVPRRPELEGMSLADVAAGAGRGLGETLCQLLLDEELKIGHLGAPPRSPALWRVTFAEGAAPDKRDYRVDFGKVTRACRASTRSWTVPPGSTSWGQDMERRGLTAADLEGPRFVPAQRIQELMAAGSPRRPLSSCGEPAPRRPLLGQRMRAQLERLYPLCRSISATASAGPSTSSVSRCPLHRRRRAVRDGPPRLDGQRRVERP